MPEKYKANTKGFTLAEVLITLTIIGVVAALTVPVINRADEKSLRNAYKAFFSTFAQANMRAVADSGGSVKDLTTLQIRDAHSQYLKTTKVCDWSHTSGICWHAANNWKYMNGDVVTADVTAPGLVLNNGMLVVYNIAFGGGACHAGWDGVWDGCFSVIVDVNGFKGPNEVGKDIFRLVIRDADIMPFGRDPSHMAATDVAHGWASGYKIMTNQDY